MWPPDDELFRLWRCLVDDPDTDGAFAAAVLRPLEADLARCFPRSHPDDVATAADDALVQRPTQFDPARASLPAFHRMAARRDYLNLRRAEGRHHRGRKPW